MISPLIQWNCHQRLECQRKMLQVGFLTKYTKTVPTCESKNVQHSQLFMKHTISPKSKPELTPKVFITLAEIEEQMKK